MTKTLRQKFSEILVAQVLDQTTYIWESVKVLSFASEWFGLDQKDRMKMETFRFFSL